MSLALSVDGALVALHQNRDGGCASRTCVLATVDLRAVPWVWDPARLDPMIHADYGVLLPLQAAAAALALEAPVDAAVSASIDAVRRDWGHVGALPPDVAAATAAYRDSYAAAVERWGADLARAKAWTPSGAPA